MESEDITVSVTSSIAAGSPPLKGDVAYCVDLPAVGVAVAVVVSAAPVEVPLLLGVLEADSGSVPIPTEPVTLEVPLCGRGRGLLPTR